MVPTPRHMSQITILQTVVLLPLFSGQRAQTWVVYLLNINFNLFIEKIIIKSLLKTSQKGFQQMLMELWNYHYQKFEHMINCWNILSRAIINR